MNSRNNFNVAPLFSWPQLSPTGIVLEIGSLGSCSYGESTPRNISWNCMNEVQTYNGFDIRQITSITQIFPHTRRYYPDIQYRYPIAKRSSAKSAQILKDSYPEFDISQEYIAATFLEESYNESNYKIFDPYMSNELISVGSYEFGPGMIEKFMTLPMGTSGTELNFIPLSYDNALRDSNYIVSQYQPDLSNISTLNFKTPIKQVSSSIYENTPTINKSRDNTFNCCPSLLAIRTMSGTTFLKIINTGSELKAIALDSIIHEDDLEHMHVTFNPMIYGEAAIVDGNGGIHLWKGERHEDYSKFFKYNFKTVHRSQIDVDLPFKDLWRTCVYGAHPQTLIVASRTSADIFDFRSRSVTLPQNLFGVNNKDKIFSFQRSPVSNAYEFALTTQNDVILLDQRFSKRPMLTWAHHHSSPPSGVNIITKKQTSMVLIWSKNPPTITSFQYLTSASGPVISTNQPVSIPPFTTHPTFSRSKYLRTPHAIRDDKITEGSIQQHKLPPLSSVLLLENNVSSRNSTHLGSCFSIFQLSQTGALYSQVFQARAETDSFIQQSVPSKLQISDMPNSIASLHYLADMDVGTTPELRVKQNQSWSFEKLWNYISKDFKCESSSNNISPFVLETGALFFSWESVENYFEHYGHAYGFNCQKRSIIKDLNGNVRSLTYACMEAQTARHRIMMLCEWRITLSSIKSNECFIVTEFINQHNHDLFSALYNSEGCRSRIGDDIDMGVISTEDSIKEALMSFDTLQESYTDPFAFLLKKFYHDNRLIVDNTGHPLTLYEILRNIPNSHINGSEAQSVQQFSETSKFKKDSLELFVEWSLFDVNLLFEHLWNEDLNSALTISQIYGFPNINVTKNPADIEKDIKFYLQKAYPLSANKSGVLENTDVDDQIKRSRQNAIDEVSRDLVECSQSFISKPQKCLKFLLSSDLLPEQNSINDLANSDIFTIKCKKPINDDGYVMSTAAQELFDDWIIDQNLEEYDYRFLEDVIEKSKTSISILETEQEEALLNETENPSIGNIEGYESTNFMENEVSNRAESSRITLQPALNASEGGGLNKILEKPKKKKRRSGFR
ncbi:15883_t:CDS:10 [Funneliformis mosseae]|uniref:15883_t:CDS:1 n=1 Tax=Funneliformis mosseae TaxID=27381 RepID=A0A9N9F4J4_FUNMO|nr:15883_t:CDS:10 [Funneliformis mosseae]